MWRCSFLGCCSVRCSVFVSGRWFCWLTCCCCCVEGAVLWVVVLLLSLGVCLCCVLVVWLLGCSALGFEMTTGALCVVQLRAKFCGSHFWLRFFVAGYFTLVVYCGALCCALGVLMAVFLLFLLLIQKLHTYLPRRNGRHAVAGGDMDGDARLGTFHEAGTWTLRRRAIRAPESI